MSKGKPTKPSSGGGTTSISSSTVGCGSPCPPPDPWLRDALAVMCPKDKAFLDDLRARGVTITAFDRIYYEDPYFDGKKWTTQHFEAGGSTSGTNMNIVVGSHKPESVAETIYHEGVHTGQPSSMSWREKEYDAYTKGEQWAIDHGLPGRPGFRKTDSKGKSVPDTDAIKSFVDKQYPITEEKSTPKGPIYKVIGKDSKGDVIIQNTTNPSDIKTRKPKAGDTFPGPQIEKPPGGRPAQPCQLKCC